MELNTLAKATELKEKIDLSKAALNDYEDLCESVPKYIETLLNNQKSTWYTGMTGFFLSVKGRQGPVHMVDKDGKPVKTGMPLRTEKEWRMLLVFLLSTREAVRQEIKTLEEELAAI